MPLRLLLLGALCCSPAALFAETVYVGAGLRVGIYAAEDGSGVAFENLAGGTSVDLLERKGDTARVRLSDGREGWARAADLMPVATPAVAESYGDSRDALDARRYEEQLDAYRYSMPLWVAGALAVVALVTGFTAGIWWIDLRIRRRHGGFRIY